MSSIIVEDTKWFDSICRLDIAPDISFYLSNVIEEVSFQFAGTNSITFSFSSVRFFIMELDCIAYNAGQLKNN